MRILMSGGSGFIGRNLSRRLVESGHQVFCLCRESSVFYFEHENLHKIIVSGYCEMEDAFRLIHPSGVIHLATRFDVSHKPEHIPEILHSNIEYGTLLLEAACNTGVQWFLNTGTYWQHLDGGSYSPVNFYAASKQAFEDIARFYYSQNRIHFTTLCLNDTYGPGDTRRKIFNIWRDLEETTEHLPMSAGEQIMNMVYIDDVVSAFLLLALRLDSKMEKENGKIYYLSSSETYSLKELAGIFQDVSGKKLSIAWGKLPYRPREVMNPRCFGELLPGWSPQISFREGIRKFLGVK